MVSVHHVVLREVTLHDPQTLLRLACCSSTVNDHMLADISPSRQIRENTSACWSRTLSGLAQTWSNSISHTMHIPFLIFHTSCAGFPFLMPRWDAPQKPGMWATSPASSNPATIWRNSNYWQSRTALMQMLTGFPLPDFNWPAVQLTVSIIYRQDRRKKICRVAKLASRRCRTRDLFNCRSQPLLWELAWLNKPCAIPQEPTAPPSWQVP